MGVAASSSRWRRTDIRTMAPPMPTTSEPTTNIGSHWNWGSY